MLLDFTCTIILVNSIVLLALSHPLLLKCVIVALEIAQFVLIVRIVLLVLMDLVSSITPVSSIVLSIPLSKLPTTASSVNLVLLLAIHALMSLAV